jgi:pyrimidine-specific ribonucleoside hydrolase
LRDLKDFNYNIDSKSVAAIIKEEVPVRSVAGFREQRFFTDELIEEISVIKNVYSKSLTGFFESENVKNHSFSFSGYDEMIPLYLHFPEIFKNEAVGKNFESIPCEKSLLKAGAVKILKGETVPRNQVINVLPAEPSFYFDDINPSVNEIIRKYGMNEWTSGVIANELHRHLGVFAIVGVKMGIRAREYFNTGVDEFRVTSRAGSMPPLSCMNDGLQVSTGATPGHGLLTISTDTLKLPSAEFTYLNHKIRLSLKPEIADKISSELKEINFIHGLDSDIYWELVRKNSIKYWLELDRNEIFIIEEI